MNDALPETLLAIDFGEKRIGIAVGNTLSRTATPERIIHHSALALQLDAITEIVTHWRAKRLILGMPFHMDGSRNLMTEKVLAFGEALMTHCNLPLHFVDERLTSQEADDYRILEARQATQNTRKKGSFSRKSQDDLAAALILSRFFTHPTPAHSPLGENS